MIQNEQKLIPELSDHKFVNSIIPGGIIITDADKNFNLLEANDGYFELIGYTREEFYEVFNNCGRKTVHPTDADVTLKSFMNQIKSDPTKQLDAVFRLVNKVSSYRTVQCSGRLFTDETGKRKFCFQLLDITAYCDVINNLQREKDFNALIASLTENVFFDYDVARKTMRFSKNFADRLKIPPIIENFQYSKIGKDIFKDFINIFSDDYLESPNANEKIESEVSISLRDGETAWYLYSCETLYDAQGNKSRMVGKMLDVTDKKFEIEMLKEKSEVDLLTGVYNRMTTENYISEYLVEAPDDKKCALIIIDLDNFKQINDTFGHLYGDECLEDVGFILKKMFRSIDIIGRIGGDEFFVFVKGYVDLTVLTNKVEKLCTNLAKTYSYNGKDVSISASVGVALYPKHGKDFKTLYEKADTALYKSKNVGKNTYFIYE